jgi:hypothetical protein
MDEVALKNLLSRLESLDGLRSQLHSSLRFWEWVVVAGVCVEFVVLVWEYWHDLRDFRRGGIWPPKKPSPALLLLGLLGVGMVAVGIGKELSTDSLIERVETEIRAANSLLFGIVKQSAEEAINKSNAANDAAGKAQEKVAVVGKRADEIDADLARTQYLLSGRSVTDFDSLVEKLKPYALRTVHIGSTSEIEHDSLCAAIYKAAYEAKVDAVDDCGRMEEVGQTSTGVVISGPNLQETQDIAQILLHKCNLGPGGTQSGQTSPVLRIFVGAKPPFMATQARGVKIPKKQTTKAKTKP